MRKTSTALIALMVLSAAIVIMTSASWPGSSATQTAMSSSGAQTASQETAQIEAKSGMALANLAQTPEIRSESATQTAALSIASSANGQTEAQISEAVAASLVTATESRGPDQLAILTTDYRDAECGRTAMAAAIVSADRTIQVASAAECFAAQTADVLRI